MAFIEVYGSICPFCKDLIVEGQLFGVNMREEKDDLKFFHTECYTKTEKSFREIMKREYPNE